MVSLPDGSPATFISEAADPPPTALRPIDDTTRASDALRLIRDGHTLLWTGDYRNGRHLLTALRRRIDRQRRDPLPTALGPRWRAERTRTRERGQLLGRVVVALQPDGSLDLARAPDTRQAVAWAWEGTGGVRIVALTTLVGALSAAEWTRKGLEVPGLNGRLIPRFGVFSPTRNAYVALLDAVDPVGKSVLDVGCGTGVLGFVLLQRGAASVVGIDVESRAVACASHNATALGLADRYTAVHGDLFPPGARFDLVVFNAPWVPEVPRTRLDRAVFDADGATLTRFLGELADHLRPGGVGALLISDLPERLGLRQPGELEARIHDAGLELVRQVDRPATHRRARDGGDSLAAARAQERVRMLVCAVRDAPVGSTPAEET